MYNRIKNHSGFTMIEIILAIVILGILILMFTPINKFAFGALTIGKEQYNTQHDIRMVTDFITNEIRHSRNVEILSDKPAAFDDNKKYIYVEGSAIKYHAGGTTKDIIKDPDGTLVPSLLFNESTVNEKILKFTVKGKYNGQDYSIASEVLPINILPTDIDPITKLLDGSDGKAISFGPFTDLEKVEADKELLDLADYNPYLVAEADESLTLPADPDLDIIVLPNIGENDSSILWSSDNTSVIANDGSVTKPAAGSGDISVLLTATIKKTTGGITEQATKGFIINVCDLD